MLGIGTTRTNRLSGCTFKNEKDMKKSGRGTYDTKVDTTNKIVATKWYDNKFVHVVSNYKGIHPLDEVERWSTAKKERVVVPRPASIKEYNRFMGGVDLHDMLVELYRTDIRV
ncbi:piggyBac transposable element-derived protein 3-like [Melanaphis sacchari]|uniref:piggyBac transposable element-derived protein 3-like n=1 Tax=Melanaphis sacchari TaxID=742174 RepID=UPI000DC139AD|nr:piggyBac transposable element-derived protein 3-like [Melanaphis sacchari]